MGILRMMRNEIIYPAKLEANHLSRKDAQSACFLPRKVRGPQAVKRGDNKLDSIVLSTV